MKPQLESAEEEEANLFAMSLIMPEAFVRDEVRKMGGLDLCSDKAIKKLADRFQVPMGMMAFRLAQLR